MRLFVPPGRVERVQSGHPLFGRMTIKRGVTLLKEGGIYRQVEHPSSEEMAAAEAAYIGGHVYVVSIEEAAALSTAGYGDWVRDYGYGSGLYGDDTYGGE